MTAQSCQGLLQEREVDLLFQPFSFLVFSFSFSVFVCLFLNISPHSHEWLVIHAGLKLVAILLPLPSEYSGYRCGPVLGFLIMDSCPVSHTMASLFFRQREGNCQMMSANILPRNICNETVDLACLIFIHKKQKGQHDRRCQGMIATTTVYHVCTSTQHSLLLLNLELLSPFSTQHVFVQKILKIFTITKKSLTKKRPLLQLIIMSI